jgi:hypothetical protein
LTENGNSWVSEHKNCEIWGFHGSKNVDCSLLSYVLVITNTFEEHITSIFRQDFRYPEDGGNTLVIASKATQCHIPKVHKPQYKIYLLKTDPPLKKIM